MNEPFAFYEKTADYVKSRAPFAPELGLILGTGLGPLAKQIENPVEIDYQGHPELSRLYRARPRGQADFRYAGGEKARVYVRAGSTPMKDMILSSWRFLCGFSSSWASNN